MFLDADFIMKTTYSFQFNIKKEWDKMILQHLAVQYWVWPSIDDETRAVFALDKVRTYIHIDLVCIYNR